MQIRLCAVLGTNGVIQRTLDLAMPVSGCSLTDLLPLCSEFSYLSHLNQMTSDPSSGGPLGPVQPSQTRPQSW